MAQGRSYCICHVFTPILEQKNLTTLLPQTPIRPLQHILRQVDGLRPIRIAKASKERHDILCRLHGVVHSGHQFLLWRNQNDFTVYSILRLESADIYSYFRILDSSSDPKREPTCLFIVCYLKIALSCFHYVFCLCLKQVIHRLPVPFCGDELHHSGWNACSRLVNYN